LPLSSLIALRRNPQYLTEKQNEALKESIQREGFLSPVLVRKNGKRYEVLSGNHRVGAARELNLERIPCVIMEHCTQRQAQRIAVNMNSIHGDPNVELLAPFLAEMDDKTLGEIFLPKISIGELIEFDRTLELRLAELSVPDALDNEAVGNIPECLCPKCGRRHVTARESSKSNKAAAKNTNDSK
jgi:ParB-like chromosome segregation protein Spo0J